MGRETNKSRRESSAASAREKAAAAKAQQRQTEQKRRAFQVIGGILVVVILVVVAVVISLNHKGKSDTTVNVASTAVVSGITGVTTDTINTVAKGSSGGTLGTISDAPYTAAGKPNFLYIGAEFCPFCAAERWSMIQALSRFGTFTGLKEIHSSEDNLPTFTFTTTKYTSKYVSFTPREIEDQNHKSLQTLTDAETTIFKKYSPSEAFPFLYFGGKAVQSGAGYDPELLSGKTHAAISSDLSDPTAKTTQGIVGEANSLTAAICLMTNNQPSNVCSQPAVTSAKAALKPFVTTS